MFCNNCGTQIQDGAPFCPNCGASTQANNPAPAAAPAPEANPAPAYQPVGAPVAAPTAPAKKKFNFNKKLIKPIIAVVLAVVILVGAISLFGGDPKDKYFISKSVYVYYDGNGNVTSKSTYEYYNDGDDYIDDENYFTASKRESDGQVTSETKIERDKKGRITKVKYSEYGETKYTLRFEEYEKEDGIYVAEAKYEEGGQVTKIKIGYKKDVFVLYEERYNDQLQETMERDGKKVVKKNYDAGEVVGVRTIELDKKDNPVRIEYKCDTDSTEDYVVTYKYDRKGNQLEYVHTDSEGEVTEKLVREYDKNGNCTSYIVYDKENNVTDKYTAKYNKYDICIELEYRDENDEVIQTAKVKKESKDSIVVEYLDKDETVQYYIEYTIAKGKVTEEKHYDGKTDELTSVAKYNKNGLVEEEREYDSEGKLVQKSTYEWSKK